MSKWGGRPHWEFEAFLLGSDRYGDWVGVPAGTYMSRPGAEVTTPVDQVSLVPVAGVDADRGWLATFHAVGGPVRVYVDITTPPAWDGPTLRAVDLDLDVISETSGEVRVDDEDEFADHRVRFGYPEDVIELARANCHRVRAALAASEAPYDGRSATGWLRMLSC
jgi:uncharacterized protein